MSRPAVRVSVTPAVSLEDQSVQITAAGLSPHQAVVLRLSSRDQTGVRWESQATFVANASGVINPDTSAALRGDYTGVWSMGLISSMQPTRPTTEPAYAWPAHRPARFTLSVTTAGQTRTSTTFQRRAPTTGLVTRAESLKQVGFIGRFVYPQTATHRTAILLLGGSDGGLPSALSADILAAQGYPVLALGYFKLPGLPQHLSRIPLGYFHRALQWLHGQPQVDPHRIVILGVSRGTEAALLVATHFPRLVGAVIALVPSDAAICAVPGCRGPAWTYHGQAIPYTRQFGNPHPTDHPDAVIPVQHIHAPIFQACGTADGVWPSCAYAHAINHQLTAAHDSFPHPLYTYTNAGHSVGSFTPDDPTSLAVLTDDHPQTDQQARARDWPRILTWLATFSHSG